MNTYSGGTALNGGTLIVGDASTPTASIGDITVNAGGTLAGYGILGTINNVSGNFAPGFNAAGTLHAAKFTQGSGGTLVIQVTPSSSSQLIVSGAASLNGTLKLNFASGTYTATQYTLVSAGSLSGTFGTVTGSVPTSGLSQSVTYNATSAQLVVSASATDSGSGNSTGNSGTGNDSTGACSSAKKHSGSSGGGGGGAGIALGVGAAAGALVLLTQSGDGAGAAAWSQAYGDMAGPAHALALSTSDSGFVAGLSRGLHNNFDYGISLAYNRGPLLNDPGKGMLTSARFGVYGAYTRGPVSVVAALTNGQYLADPREGANSQTHESEATLRLSYDIPVSDFLVTPNAGFLFTALSEQSGFENGLEGNPLAATAQALHPFAGAEIKLRTGLFGTALRPELRAVYDGPTSLLIPQDDESFAPPGTFPERHTLDIGAGFETASWDNVSLSAQYNMHVSPVANVQSLNAALHMQF